MRWSRRLLALLAELGLLGVVALALLLSHVVVAWLQGHESPEDHWSMVLSPQRCVLTIGDPGKRSPVLDLDSVTDMPECLFPQRALVQMQGVQVWSDVGEVEVEPYARLAREQFPLPPGDRVFAADGFGISGIHIHGAPRYVQILFRYTIHAHDAQHVPLPTTVVMTPTCAARCWRAVVEAPTASTP